MRLKSLTETDQVIDMAWSNIQVNQFVRWATPRFIKYGRVLKIGGTSLMVQFIEDARPTAIPDAKWYFVEGKRDPQAEEHLVCIDYQTWYNGPPTQPFIPPHSTSGQFISVAEACELIRMDPKQLRRHIRRGVIPAEKRDDRWVIDREALQSISAKNGWI